MGQFARLMILRDYKQFLITITLACVVLVALRIEAVAEDAAKEPSDEVKISLRSSCGGECVFGDYTVSIFGDGRVVYEAKPKYARNGAEHLVSRFGPLLLGKREDHVSPSKVAELVKKFEAAQFGKLKDKYQGDGDDFPSSELTITSKQLTKSVFEYAGSLASAGMPHVVFDLEKEVGELAGVRKWLFGDKSLVPWLEEQKFNFNSDEASQIVAAAAASRDVPELTILALLEKGISLDREVELDPSYGEKATPVPAGQIVLESAIERGQTKTFLKLVAAGWLTKVGVHYASESFARSGGSCNPEFVDAAVAAGIDPKAEVVASSPMMNDPTGGRDALMQLVDKYCGSKSRSQLAVVKRLLSFGVDPNHRDQKGQTAIFYTLHDDALKFLLAHGADAKILDNNGLSAVFSNLLDDNMLTLLKAGASPAGFDKQCRDFSKLLQILKNVKSEKWLAAHPKALSSPVSLYASGKGRCDPLTSVY